MTYASPEARWLAERLIDGKGLVSGWGRRIINLSYNQPDRGSGVLWRRRRRKGKLQQIIGK